MTPKEARRALQEKGVSGAEALDSLSDETLADILAGFQKLERLRRITEEKGR